MCYQVYGGLLREKGLNLRLVGIAEYLRTMAPALSALLELAQCVIQCKLDIKRSGAYCIQLLPEKILW